MNARFDSPNDLAVGRDGTLYFSDPDYQAPSPLPQPKTGAYRVAPGGSTATTIADGRQQPNGVTLSPDGSKLYLSGSDGVYVYPVMADGSLGGGTRFGNVSSSDGMAIDCAGNLYTTANQEVTILDSMGKELGKIAVGSVQSVTNLAFGGADHKTLYITALGASGQAGLFRLQAAVPGLPY
jgi:gluconolactonase